MFTHAWPSKRYKIHFPGLAASRRPDSRPTILTLNLVKPASKHRSLSSLQVFMSDTYSGICCLVMFAQPMSFFTVCIHLIRGQPTFRFLFRGFPFNQSILSAFILFTRSVQLKRRSLIVKFKCNITSQSNIVFQLLFYYKSFSSCLVCSTSTIIGNNLSV